jgi:hypothetical protein
MRYEATILATVIALVVVKAEIGVDIFEKLSCDTIIREGWAKMPDVAKYIGEIRGSEKLGYASECHLGGLVFAQCFVEPRLSVKKAVEVLIHKAITGTRLPDTPVCGA